MRYFESFAGVGGIGMGLPTDWELVGVSEVDKYASQVLAYHYPNVKNYGDITKVNWSQVPDFCERLMSWPDNWTRCGSQGEISDSQRYKMCGNGVVSAVVREIISHLI